MRHGLQIQPLQNNQNTICKYHPSGRWPRSAFTFVDRDINVIHMCKCSLHSPPPPHTHTHTRIWPSTGKVGVPLSAGVHSENAVDAAKVLPADFVVFFVVLEEDFFQSKGRVHRLDRVGRVARNLVRNLDHGRRPIYALKKYRTEKRKREMKKSKLK